MNEKRIVVVAFWGGERRVPGLSPAENVRTWQWALKEYHHNLDAVALVRNIGPNDPDDYLEALAAFETNVPLFRIDRENKNGSYGAWKAAWDVFKDEYQWYFLFEDDYRPGAQDWDSKILACVRPGDGYCGARLSFPEYEKHMGHACGVVRQDALALSSVNKHDLHIYNPALQIGFAHEMLEHGYGLSDYAEKYSVPFRSGQGIREIGNPEGEALIVPVEI